MLNYTSQAIDSLKHFPLKGLDPKTRAFFLAVLVLLEEAVRVELPENGEVLDDDSALENFTTDVRRLPFKVTAFEFPMALFDGKEGRVRSSKRIALAFEIRSEDTYKDFFINQYIASLNISLREAVAPHQTEGFLGIIPLCYLDDLKSWVPILGTALIGYLEDPEVFLEDVAKLSHDRQVGERARYSLFPWIREDTQLYALPAGDSTLDVYIRMQKKVTNPTDAFLGLLSDLEAEVLVTIRTLVLLSAHNVSLAPAKGFNLKGLSGLNKKRSKAGKSPVKPPMEIIINPGQTKTAASPSYAEGDYPARKSPETHWRRGHIRRLSSGKRTWVSPALIGAVSREKVAGEKYYRIKAMQRRSKP